VRVFFVDGHIRKDEYLSSRRRKTVNEAPGRIRWITWRIDTMSSDTKFSPARRKLMFKGAGAVAATTLLGACGGASEPAAQGKSGSSGVSAAGAATASRQGQPAPATVTVTSCGQAGATSSCVLRSFTINVDPVDPAATPAAKALYSWLVSKFGKFIVSGQTDQDHFDYVKNLTGNYPLLRGFDMQHYSPMYAWLWDGNAINPSTGQQGYFTFGPDSADPSIANSIAWRQNNGNKPLISYQWHWHSPSGGTVGTNTFYTEYTTFDASRAVKKGTQEYTDTLRDIDAIAIQLKKLSDAGVPIIWRPLHEAGGTWFWWSAKGSTVYKQLWAMMYDRLVNYHGLHHLLWCWSGDDAAWYPGNDKVDIIGIDSYPGNFVYINNKAEFDKAYALSNGTKLIAMTENGPMPDIETSLDGGAPWSFFMSWVDVTAGNDDAQLMAVYGDPRVITLERFI
jgi:mannan endo-1,4-beta-mannosidase